MNAADQPSLRAVVLASKVQHVPSTAHTAHCCGAEVFVSRLTQQALDADGITEPFMLCETCAGVHDRDSLMAFVAERADRIKITREQLDEIGRVVGVASADQLQAALRDRGVVPS